MKTTLTTLLILAALSGYGQKKHKQRIHYKTAPILSHAQSPSYTDSLMQNISNGITSIPLMLQNTTFFDMSADPFVSVIGPDSTGTYTVVFTKSKVKFINDSTFTFKVKK